MATSFFCQAKYILRRSTGFPEEMKRVEVLRGKERWGGPVNCRCVAIARFSIASEVGVGFGEAVGIGGLFEAIERRRLISGSEEGESIMAGILGSV